MNKTKLRKVLSACGLNTNAVRIYLEAHSRGEVSRRDLSKTLSLPETTTKDNLNLLVRHGLLTTERTSRGRVVSVVPPAKAFRRLMDRQRQVKKRATETITGLRALATKTAGR